VYRGWYRVFGGIWVYFLSERAQVELKKVVECKPLHWGTFDTEGYAARVRDRMMVWCDLHRVVLKQFGAGAYSRSLLSST
jgi:hypothetical protein